MCSCHGLHVIGAGRDPLADLLVAAAHLRVVAIYVLTAQPVQLLVVTGLDVMAASLDGAHVVLLMRLVGN